MANLKSSKKDILVNKRNRERNQHYKSKMKTFIKQALVAIAEDTANALPKVKETLKQIDKTASKGVIKKQKAARLKSRLQKKFNTASAA